MSFNEFLQWLRTFFNRSQRPDVVTPTRPVDPSPSPQTPLPNTTPTDPAPNVSSPQPTTPISPIITPSPPPEAVSPTLLAIDTDHDKVALNQDVTFQLTARPFGQYGECELDLSETNGATLVKNIDADGRFVLRFSKVSLSDSDQQTLIVSNSHSSVRKQVTVSRMRSFWNNHSGRKNICDHTLFVNQCAIRMGAALELSGIKIPLDRRVLRRCTTEYRTYKHHKQGGINGHILAAQELANWIKSQTATFGPRTIVHSKAEIEGRSGILFFRDGWGTTDHIDVWDGESLVGGFPSYFDSDFKELWFWEIY